MTTKKPSTRTTRPPASAAISEPVKPADAGRRSAAPKTAESVPPSFVQGPVRLPADFLTRLAHELRSPLNVISGALEELRAASSLTETQARMGELAMRGIRRIVRLADRLRMIASSERSNDPAYGRIDVGDTVRLAVQASEAVEKRAGVELSLEIDPSVRMALVSGDREEVCMALCEVLCNGFVHARSRVAVTVVPYSGDIPGPGTGSAATEVRISIDDDGAGFERVEKGTPLDQVLSPRGSAGLGIGLSLAHALLARHGGGLFAEESRLPPGRPGTVGARVVVHLPIASRP